jgi:Na+-driven multidrug efflux pump
MNNRFVKNHKAHNLYVNRPLLKAILIVIIPSLAMTFMTGIYIFTSQVIINRLVPIAHGSDVATNFQYWFGVSESTIKNLLGDKKFYDVGDVVKGAMSISSPLVTIIGSSPFFLAGGAAVLFTQSMGKQSKYKADQVFKTSFYMVLILAVIETSLLLGLHKVVLTAMSSPAEYSADAVLNAYYQKVHDLQISFASEYTFIYSAGIILPLLIFYLASLIKSEGRFKLVVFTSIACNVLNIGLIVIFILFGHLDMYGGALGSTVSYAINLLVLLFYLIHLNRTDQTWLSFKLLFKRGEAKIK